MTADDTIFALSSGAPPAAISIIRLSGPLAGPTLASLAGSLPEPRRATVRPLHDAGGVLLDRALVLWFPGPDSATGEDLAELHLHGGRAVVSAVSASLAMVPDCRAAAPGEFTRRAFANGRIDLAQAESLADLLAAETESQRRQAIRGAEGALGRAVAAWRDRLIGLAAGIEAELDFADEDDVAVQLRDPRLAMIELADEIEEALRIPPAERLRDGVRVVIAGPPNSGKSSLVNALSGRDAAIVSPLAGTTRDRIEVPIALDGLPLLLIDTAGLRDSIDEIERIGISRANDAVATADLVLWLGQPRDAPIEDKVIIVHAKSDLPGREVPAPRAHVACSIHDGGMNGLRRLLSDRIGKLLPGENALAVNSRQRLALCDCETAIRSATGTPQLECAAEDLRAALAHLDGTIGVDSRSEVIDAVFSRFCLGK